MNNNHKFSKHKFAKHKFAILTLLVALGFSSVVEAQTVQDIQNIQARRKWSPQAKGTVIGAGAGAAAGAIIHKRNRVAGGVVGGVVGGAAGYAIGKRIDNKRKAAAALAARRAEEDRIAAARREDVLAYGEANRTMRSANRNRSLGVPTSARATGAVAAGAGLASAYVSAGPAAAQPGYVTDMGYLLNPTYGDQSTAYPESEVRRKSW